MRCLTPDETRIKILSLLDEKGMNVKELNDKIGASGLNLYKYLSGKTLSIRADVLAAVALALDVPTDYLLFDSDTTGRRITVAGAADFLGLSANSIRYIRSLAPYPSDPILGLESALTHRTACTELFEIFSEAVTSSSVGSDREFLLFRACRAVCNLINRM